MAASRPPKNPRSLAEHICDLAQELQTMILHSLIDLDLDLASESESSGNIIIIIIPIDTTYKPPTSLQINRATRTTAKKKFYASTHVFDATALPDATFWLHKFLGSIPLECRALVGEIRITRETSSRKSPYPFVEDRMSWRERLSCDMRELQYVINYGVRVPEATVRIRSQVPRGGGGEGGFEYLWLNVTGIVDVWHKYGLHRLAHRVIGRKLM